MILTLALLALPQIATPSCTLVEGIGADFAKLGVASVDRKGSLPKHISLQYENNVLVRIFIFQEDCRTSKGIKIGDSEREVSALYGESKKKTKPYSLTGGAPVPVGKPGDWIYEYPGVSFLIHEGKVVEFAIQAIQS
jgi:hypothetical protein